MDPEDLPDLRDYSQEGLRLLLVDSINRVFDEEKRRESETDEFIFRLCLLDKRCLLWYHVLKSGGLRRFGEIHALARKIGIRSESTVSGYLRGYVELGLAVKHSDGRYQMIGLRWLEQG